MVLGIDLGTSSIKLSLLDTKKNRVFGTISYPKIEMEIKSPNKGWAEQNPEIWWKNFEEAYRILIKKEVVNPKYIQAIGISYQMHGLVIVDKEQRVLRPSIIWCDSRAVDIGNEAYEVLGKNFCLSHLLNSPGNFTASKLAWIKRNEPETFEKIHKIMLPGDYFVMKLTGEITTTKTGLSEGIFWDFKTNKISNDILATYDIPRSMLPDVVPSIGSNLNLSKQIASKLDMNQDVNISYRAGDQPNHAFSLNVLKKGEIAATAGTSGVIYAVTDQKLFDPKSRINTFLHVNNTEINASNGILVCVNGTGILYSWLKKLLNNKSNNIDYCHMNNMVESVTPGSEKLICFPFGNGAERIFENKLIGSHYLNLDFNRHNSNHILRASVEGIVYALNLGFDILTELNVSGNTIRAGKANLFLSKVFREIFVNVTETRLEVYNTDGAIGAARGAALGSGLFSSAEEAFRDLELSDLLEPKIELTSMYKELYLEWKDTMIKHSFIGN